MHGDNITDITHSAQYNILTMNLSLTSYTVFVLLKISLNFLPPNIFMPHRMSDLNYLNTADRTLPPHWLPPSLALLQMFSQGLLQDLNMPAEQVERLFPQMDELIEIHTTFLAQLLRLQQVKHDRSIDDVGRTLLDQVGQPPHCISWHLQFDTPLKSCVQKRHG